MMDEVVVNTAGKTISKEAAVQIFGSDRQQEHFNKYKKFTNKKIEDALIKTLEERFASVEKVKSGRSIKYQLGEARNEIVERVDNRGKNNELSYSKHLDAIILMALESELFDEYETTLKHWVYNFGLANTALFTLSKNGILATDKLRKSLFQQGLINDESHTAELREFQKDFNTKKDVLKRTLTRMDKENLINFYKVPKVKLRVPLEFKNPEGQIYTVDVLTISSTLEKEITNKQRELREYYELENYHTFIEDTENMKDEKLKKSIESYHRGMRSFFKDKHYQDDFGTSHKIQIERFWFNYAISVKATPTRIKNYIQKHRPAFYEEYITDNNLFFENNKDKFATERTQVLLQKAYDTSKKEQSKILEKYEGGFGKIPAPEQKNLNYWENDFVDNVRRIEATKFQEDFNQGIK